jgi:CopG family nickel-responsive transcriptional regulator
VVILSVIRIQSGYYYPSIFAIVKACLVFYRKSSIFAGNNLRIKKLWDMPLKRFGVSLEDNLLESLDQYVSENGFANRSQAIRFLVEKNVAEKKWQCNHIVAGTIILMYDQVKKDITSRIADIQQNYQDVILSSSQYYVNRNFCLHIATVMGTAYRLTELSDRLTTIKGLKHGKLVMSRAD